MGDCYDIAVAKAPRERSPPKDSITVLEPRACCPGIVCLPHDDVWAQPLECETTAAQPGSRPYFPSQLSLLPRARHILLPAPRPPGGDASWQVH